jgi:hypothetical protein
MFYSDIILSMYVYLPIYIYEFFLLSHVPAQIHFLTRVPFISSRNSYP